MIAISRCSVPTYPWPRLLAIVIDVSMIFLLLGVKSFGESTVGVPIPTLFLTAFSTSSAVMFLAVRAV